MPINIHRELTSANRTKVNQGVAEQGPISGREQRLLAAILGLRPRTVARYFGINTTGMYPASYVGQEIATLLEAQPFIPEPDEPPLEQEKRKRSLSYVRARAMLGGALGDGLFQPRASEPTKDLTFVRRTNSLAAAVEIGLRFYDGDYDSLEGVLLSHVWREIYILPFPNREPEPDGIRWQFVAKYSKTDKRLRDSP